MSYLCVGLCKWAPLPWRGPSCTSTANHSSPSSLCHLPDFHPNNQLGLSRKLPSPYHLPRYPHSPFQATDQQLLMPATRFLRMSKTSTVFQQPYTRERTPHHQMYQAIIPFAVGLEKQFTPLQKSLKLLPACTRSLFLQLLYS